eukprot:3494748-Pleurochrysis_carterae.AAC.2
MLARASHARGSAAHGRRTFSRSRCSAPPGTGRRVGTRRTDANRRERAQQTNTRGCSSPDVQEARERCKRWRRQKGSFAASARGAERLQSHSRACAGACEGAWRRAIAEGELGRGRRTAALSPLRRAVQSTRLEARRATHGRGLRLACDVSTAFSRSFASIACGGPRA